ncbi:transposon Tf2-11 polyprotein [Trichonephila clavipes]|nr:transposon Tf2-11 polyprotein [Trichonephila clavipes]
MALLWKEFASDPGASSTIPVKFNFASFRNFVVIHSIFRASSPRISESPVYFKERPASDPKCVVIHSSEDQFASFKIFVVIHSVFFERRHRGSANRQLIPANDPKCVVIHYSEDQLASFKNFVVIHSVFSGVITENQRIASPDYIEDDVKVMIDSIVKDRIRTEEKEEKLRRERREYEEKLRREEREYELEKLRIQAEKNANTMNNPENVQAPKDVNKQIDEWLEQGIVRPSSSEYAIPIVLVKKKDGTTRLCVDYRRLNRKLVKDRFPLPLIEDVLDRLQEPKCTQHHHRRTPRNGQVERIHRTLIPVLTKLSIDDPTKWYKFVDRLQRILNSTSNQSTKWSPFELLTGVTMRNRRRPLPEKPINGRDGRRIAGNRETSYDKMRKEIFRRFKQKIKEPTIGNARRHLGIKGRLSGHPENTIRIRFKN